MLYQINLSSVVKVSKLITNFNNQITVCNIVAKHLS